MPMSNNLPKELKLALHKKQKAETFLANLNKLKSEGSFSEHLFTTLHKEYTDMRDQAILKINTLKDTIQGELDDKRADQTVFKDELINLETRFKVGELTTEIYSKRAKSPKCKIDDLQQQINVLQALINSQRSSDIHISQPKNRFLIFNIPSIAKTAPKNTKNLTIRREYDTQSPCSLENNTAITPPEFTRETEEAMPPLQVSPEICLEPEDIMIINSFSPQTQPFTVDNLQIMPDRIKIGGNIGIMATIFNNTENTLTDNLVLIINQSVEREIPLTLEPSESQDVTFIITALAEGTHTVTLGTATGSFATVPDIN